MKLICTTLVLMVLCLHPALCQYNFVLPPSGPGDCMVNSYDSRVPNYREDVRRSVFQYVLSGGGQCTGTLININNWENNIGQYFMSSWHCFTSGKTCDGDEYDWNKEVTFLFNYQSPPGQNGLVFNNNRLGQTYSIVRKIRLVDKVSCGYGDFALCEILGAPIPPHFNPYYAGWRPLGTLQFGDFITMNHPNGSIKQAAATYHIKAGVVPGLQTCQTVTKVIDFLVGWIWRRRFSTQVICQYVQLPFIDSRYIVHEFVYGTTAEGSSGGAFFEGNNRIIGTLSGTYPDLGCRGGGGITYFGRFPAYYYRAAIKNVLNPAHKWAVDEFGIPGRNRNCYESIVYNYDQSFDFFPANLYQRDNAITLNSKTHIELGINSDNRITIKSGADFTFNAGTYIDMGPNFETELGANYTANPGVGCGFSGGYRMADEENNYEQMAREMLFEAMASIELPEELDEENMHNKHMQFTLYPNPATENVTIVFPDLTMKKLSVSIVNTLGQTVYNAEYNIERSINLELSVNQLKNGIYQVIIQSEKRREVQKLVINR